MTDAVDDLLQFIDRSPTPYHAVAEAAGRLDAAGFRALSEGRHLDPGARGCRLRDARRGVDPGLPVGTQPPAEAGFHLLGAHTDSPNLRLKPVPDVEAHGYQQFAVEPTADFSCTPGSIAISALPGG